MKVCVITDNAYSYKGFLDIIQADPYKAIRFDFYCSTRDSFPDLSREHRPVYVNLKEEEESFFSQYDLFLSLHSRQIFPEKMVENHTCINIHPGYNPYNRGWYPQVFSIINGEPVGVTIHKMDSRLDHGAILFQEKVEIGPADTSYDVYLRIQRLEKEMLKKHLPAILLGEYIETPVQNGGSIHYKKDFEALCKIDLSRQATYGEVIDHLRAVTFKGFRNAFFETEKGEKIYVSIGLEREINEK